jgi:hypothetical protein
MGIWGRGFNYAMHDARFMIQDARCKMQGRR